MFKINPVIKNKLYNKVLYVYGASADGIKNILKKSFNLYRKDYFTINKSNKDFKNEYFKSTALSKIKYESYLVYLLPFQNILTKN